MTKQRSGLNRDDLASDPIEQFARWFLEAKACKHIRDYNAFCLSTVGVDGFPEGRMLLLKHYGEDGLIFFTNLESRKGRALLLNQRAALTFYWEPLSRQIRIQGATELVKPVEADDYFNTRPRLSQLGAWASRQSEPLADRIELEARITEFETRFDGNPIPRPPHWSGFRVRPHRYEFWQEQANRLHDRFAYELNTNGWNVTRLFP